MIFVINMHACLLYRLNYSRTQELAMMRRLKNILFDKLLKPKW